MSRNNFDELLNIGNEIKGIITDLESIIVNILVTNPNINLIEAIYLLHHLDEHYNEKYEYLRTNVNLKLYDDLKKQQEIMNRAKKELEKLKAVHDKEIEMMEQKLDSLSDSNCKVLILSEFEDFKFDIERLKDMLRAKISILPETIFFKHQQYIIERYSKIKVMMDVFVCDILPIDDHLNIILNGTQALKVKNGKEIVVYDDQILDLRNTTFLYDENEMNENFHSNFQYNREKNVIYRNITNNVGSNWFGLNYVFEHNDLINYNKWFDIMRTKSISCVFDDEQPQIQTNKRIRLLTNPEDIALLRAKFSHTCYFDGMMDIDFISNKNFDFISNNNFDGMMDTKMFENDILCIKQRYNSFEKKYSELGAYHILQDGKSIIVLLVESFNPKVINEKLFSWLSNEQENSKKFLSVLSFIDKNENAENLKQFREMKNVIFREIFQGLKKSSFDHDQSLKNEYQKLVSKYTTKHNAEDLIEILKSSIYNIVDSVKQMIENLHNLNQTDITFQTLMSENENTVFIKEKIGVPSGKICWNGLEWTYREILCEDFLYLFLFLIKNEIPETTDKGKMLNLLRILKYFPIINFMWGKLELDMFWPPLFLNGMKFFESYSKFGFFEKNK